MKCDGRAEEITDFITSFGNSNLDEIFKVHGYETLLGRAGNICTKFA